MAVDEGKVFLFNRAPLHNFPQLAGDGGGFCHQNHPAGFAVEAVDQVGRNLGGAAPRQMEAHAADQAGHLPVLGGMADQPGRLVDDQQRVVFVEDVE